MTDTPKKRVWGRWAVLLVILLSIFIFYKPFGVGLGLGVVQPHVQLPAESVPPITFWLVVGAVLSLVLTLFLRRIEGDDLLRPVNHNLRKLIGYGFATDILK